MDLIILIINISGFVKLETEGLKVIYFESVDGFKKEIENGMKENR